MSHTDQPFAHVTYLAMGTVTTLHILKTDVPTLWGKLSQSMATCMHSKVSMYMPRL